MRSVAVGWSGGRVELSLSVCQFVALSHAILKSNSITPTAARPQSYETLHRAITQLSEALGRQMPALAEDAFTRLGAAAGAASGGGADEGAGEKGGVEHVFEDPEVGLMGMGGTI